MLEDYLCQVGFSGIESRLYLELLRIGPQAVSVLSKKLDLNRTTSYSILKNLEKKGVVSSYKKSSVQVFAANDPSCLVAYVDRKCKTFGYYREMVLNLVPKFRGVEESFFSKKPVVSYYDGMDGVNALMAKVNDTKKVFYAYFDFEAWMDTASENFIYDFEKIIIMSSLDIKLVAKDTQKMRIFLNKQENVLFLPPEQFDGTGMVNFIVSDGSLLIINLVKGAEYGVIIESDEVTMSCKNLFNLFWRCLKLS